MANDEQLALIKQGAQVWNAWRASHRDTEPDLSGAYLKKIDLHQFDLRQANLAWADLSGADLSQADLQDSDLSHATLNAADLNDALLDGANLREGDLRLAELPHANLTDADLSGAKLGGANLNRAFIAGANLVGADLKEAQLNDADLSDANLKRANLTRATLVAANLAQADLSNADLRDADLRGANLVRANLSHANLSGCSIYGISTWGVKFENAAQLDLVIFQPDEPTITIDQFDIAQFVYLTLTNDKLRATIQSATTNLVLILGYFPKDQKKLLDTIRDGLRQRGYVPLQLDFRSAAHECSDVIRTLTRLSRFILAEISDAKSLPTELPLLLHELQLPIQPILVEGKKELRLFKDLRQTHPGILPTARYASIEHLQEILGAEIIAPAEQRAKELPRASVL